MREIRLKLREGIDTSDKVGVSQAMVTDTFALGRREKPSIRWFKTLVDNSLAGKLEKGETLASGDLGTAPMFGTVRTPTDNASNKLKQNEEFKPAATLLVSIRRLELEMSKETPHLHMKRQGAVVSLRNGLLKARVRHPAPLP